MSKSKANSIVGLLLLVPALALPMQATAKDRPPLKGSESGSFRLLGACESGGMILEVTGSGHATKLGSYSGRYRECLTKRTSRHRRRLRNIAPRPAPRCANSFVWNLPS